MENKNDKQTQRSQPRRQNRKNKNETTPQAPASSPPTLVTEYQPSKNEALHTNLPPPPQWNYRIISFKNDYIKLQEEITKMLNTGWQLAGGVSTTMYADQYSVTTVFSQAVYRTK